MTLCAPPPAFREARLLGLFRNVGSNFNTWRHDVAETHIKGPVEEGNYPKAAAGAVLAVGSAFTEMTDYLIAGAVDKDLEAPGPGIMPRTRRDVKALIGDAVRLKPLATVANVLRLPGSVIMDVPEGFLGFDHGASVASRIRNQSASVLNN